MNHRPTDAELLKAVLEGREVNVDLKWVVGALLRKVVKLELRLDDIAVGLGWAKPQSDASGEKNEP